MSRERHTMGQDWGGRRKINPDGIPRITRKQVEELAKELGFQVRREGPGNGSWWILGNDGIWRTAGMTNYIATLIIKDYAERRKGSV